MSADFDDIEPGSLEDGKKALSRAARLLKLCELPIGLRRAGDVTSSLSYAFALISMVCFATMHCGAGSSVHRQDCTQRYRLALSSAA
jgi:hypothetical protein